MTLLPLPDKSWPLSKSLIMVRALEGELSRAGYNVGQAFQQAGIDPERLDDPQVSISSVQQFELVRFINGIMLDTYWGLAVGEQEVIYGQDNLLALGVMTSSSVMDGFNFLVKNLKVSNFLFELKVLVEGEVVRVHFSDKYQLHELREYYYWRSLANAIQFLKPYLGDIELTQLIAAIDVDFVSSCGPGVVRLEEYQGIPIRYKAEACALCLDLSSLQLIGNNVMPMVDAGRNQLLQHQCEKLTERKQTQDSLSAQVAAALDANDELWRIDLLADHLGVSVRSLSRKLKQEGSHFKNILDNSQKRKAMELLKNKKNSVELVAADLHFKDTSSFIRAFKRWTAGSTPSQFRK